jgi:hypothetical protein
MSAFSIAADGMLALIGNGAPKRLSSSSVRDSKELQVSGDGKFLSLIGPIATQIAIFSLEAEDWVPTLPAGFIEPCLPKKSHSLRPASQA